MTFVVSQFMSLRVICHKSTGISVGSYVFRGILWDPFLRWDLLGVLFYWDSFEVFYHLGVFGVLNELRFLWGLLSTWVSVGSFLCWDFFGVFNQLEAHWDFQFPILLSSLITRSFFGVPRQLGFFGYWLSFGSFIWPLLSFFGVLR